MTQSTPATKLLPHHSQNYTSIHTPLLLNLPPGTKAFLIIKSFVVLIFWNMRHPLCCVLCVECGCIKSSELTGWCQKWAGLFCIDWNVTGPDLFSITVSESYKKVACPQSGSKLPSHLNYSTLNRSSSLSISVHGNCSACEYLFMCLGHNSGLWKCGEFMNDPQQNWISKKVFMKWWLLC